MSRAIDRVTSLPRPLPAVRIITDSAIVESYRRDQAQFVEAGIPVGVAFPTTTAEVGSLVRYAGTHRIPIVPRGAGSGLSGGANAIDGGIVLSLAKMDQIVEVDAEDQLAVVQPGVINADLKVAARAAGLFYAPDPASYEFSTIGGNIATNAGGLCCVKYGVTGDSVLGLKIVIGNGDMIRTGRRTKKGVAGYDLTRLFVGSEGTLGIITEATLRLRSIPAQPATIVASFASLQAAGHAITQIMDALVPSMLELIDGTTIRAIEAWKPIGLDTSAEALLLAQSDASDQARDMECIESICRSTGATLIVRSSDPAEADLLLEARRLAFPSLERQGHVLLDDVAVSSARISDLLKAISDIGHRTEVLIGTFGHAGDGNLHPTVVFDGKNPESIAAARKAFDDIIYAALRLGGTVTGEHGVGTLKRSYLTHELGEQTLGVHRAIKRALDPYWILNPGKAF